MGAGLTNDNLRDIAATNSNLSSTNWKVWAGVRPISLFAVEADYMDLGSQIGHARPTHRRHSTHLSYKAFAGYAVGYVPIPAPVSRCLRQGGARALDYERRHHAVYASRFFSLSDNGTQFAWGIGGQLRFGNFGARLEYENFSIRNTGGVNLVSLSIFLNLL